MHIWNTRPTYIAKATTDCFEQVGWQVTQAPLQEIKAMAWHCTDVFEIGIVLSQAIWHVHPDWFQSLIHQPALWLAVGEASQRQLQDSGAQHVDCPDAPGSEGLLQMQALQSIQAKRIAVFGGMHKRDFLIKHLQQRGAHVRDIAMYQRVKSRLPTDLFTNTRPHIILATSNEIMARLIDQAVDWPWIREATLLVVSQRGYDYANKQGFKHLLRAKSASPAHCLEAIRGASI